MLHKVAQSFKSVDKPLATIQLKAIKQHFICTAYYAVQGGLKSMAKTLKACDNSDESY